MSPEKWRGRWKWAWIPPPIMWSKQKHHHIPTEQQDRSLCAGGNAKRCSHFERQVGYFLRNNTYSYHMIQQSHDLYANKLKIHVYEQNSYAGFIHNCPDLKAIKMSFNR